MAPAPRRRYDLSPLSPDDKRVPEGAERPWYMKEGELKPGNCPLDPDTGRRRAVLLPEEAPGQDRIQDQLMYFPPK